MSYISTNTIASQADQETGTSANNLVTPAFQQYHPSAAKAWVRFNGTGTVAITASYNVSSITDNGVGNYAVNITNAFSSANALNGLTTAGDSTSNITFSNISGYAANSVAVRTWGFSSTPTDYAYISVTFFGDL